MAFVSTRLSIGLGSLLFAALAVGGQPPDSIQKLPAPIRGNSLELPRESQDTLGDQALWGDELKVRAAIAGPALGDAGPGLTPQVTLGEVIDHYDRVLSLGLSAAEKSDLLRYLASP